MYSWCLSNICLPPQTSSDLDPLSVLEPPHFFLNCLPLEFNWNTLDSPLIYVCLFYLKLWLVEVPQCLISSNRWCLSSDPWGLFSFLQTPWKCRSSKPSQPLPLLLSSDISQSELKSTGVVETWIWLWPTGWSANPFRILHDKQRSHLSLEDIDQLCFLNCGIRLLN